MHKIVPFEPMVGRFDFHDGRGQETVSAPTWASSTQVLPGLSRIGLPASSMNVHAACSSGRLHVPWATRPSRSTKASPDPVVCASGLLRSAGLCCYKEYTTT